MEQNAERKSKHWPAVLNVRQYGLPLLTAMVFFSLMVWVTRPTSTSTSQAKPPKVTVRSLTPGLKLVHKEKTPDGKIRLKVQNNYPRNVDAFAVSQGENLMITDLSDKPGRRSVHPGETQEFDLAFPSKPEDYVISFWAATFDDGTGIGHPDKVKKIKEKRAKKGKP